MAEGIKALGRRLIFLEWDGVRSLVQNGSIFVHCDHWFSLSDFLFSQMNFRCKRKSKWTFRITLQQWAAIPGKYRSPVFKRKILSD